MSYRVQHDEYKKLYDVMVDPDKDTHDTLQAQGLMTRWFDILPFSGHELMWEATEYAKYLYKSLVSFDTSTDMQQQVAIMDAVAIRSQEHHLSLLVIQDNQYSEQALYRFHALVQEIKKMMVVDDTYEELYKEQYDSIDELIS